MRFTSVLAGLVSLVAAVAVLSWAIRPTPATQKPPEPVLLDQEDAPKAVPAPESPASPLVEKFSTNPFTVTSAGARPKAVIDELKHEFGRLAVNATGQHDFVIRNEGETPLKLAKGDTTCKCTGFSLGMKAVAPGESAVIHLEWTPKDEADLFSQTAIVWSNDPDNPKIEFKVEGAVVPVVRFKPSGTWAVGMISEGVPSTVKGTVACYLLDSFKIERIECDSKFVKVDSRPLEAEELSKIGALSGYELSCTVDSAIPVGVFAETVKVFTNLEEAPQMQFGVSGSRIGPFQVIGPGWTQSRQLLSMGRCAAAEGKKTQISYFVSVPEGLDFEFGEPQVTPPVVNVTVARDESFSAANGRRRYLVAIEAPPGITPGRWSDDNAIKVVLPCNHPYSSHASFLVALQAD